MADLPRIIDALNALRLELGPEIDEFIHYDAFLRRRDLLDHCRRSVERTINRLYLPGFQFASADHARWHFRNRDFLPFWVMDMPCREEHYLDNWIRAAFVSSFKHYCFEVADALKRFDESVFRTVSEFRALTETGEQSDINRSAQFIQFRRVGRNLPPGPINAPGDLMGMEPWTTRIKDLLPASALPTTERSLRRWPAQAQSQRRARASEKPRSAWRIRYIAYFGNPPCPSGQDPAKWQAAFGGYYESWEWAQPRRRRAPERTSICFREIASRELWNASARRVRYEYDD